jgi:helix-turn-helix protein
VLLLTEQWWGLPARAYTPSRGWTVDDMDAGFDRLRARGLMTADEKLTDAGSYPQRIAGVYNTGGGPHFGSGLIIDSAAELHGRRE